jgi:glucose/arabinose dehydrogenase
MQIQATPAPTAEATPQPTAVLETQVEVVATNLEVPWALAFAPDGRLFVTERPGRLRVIENGQLREEPVAELPVAHVGEGGLMGVVLDPDFQQNGHLYVMYTYSEGGTLLNRISRLTVQGNLASEETTLLEGIPGGRNHDGGRLFIGPDGKLYAGTGEGGQRNLSQDLDSLAGKVLRMNLDGSIPEDNPFPNSYIYTYGHRNPQGIDRHPGNGQIYLSEHGPSGEMGLCCRDEINRLVPGGNYGWPIVTGIQGDERFINPLLFSGVEDTWAPAGLAIYQGEPLAAWEGNLFFGALRGRHLHRVVLNDDLTEAVSEERLFEGRYGRIRAVAVGPDGYLYFTTSNRDGRGNPAAEDDRVLRIVPAP